MSEFDAMESMFAGDLIQSGPGDVSAVEHEIRSSKKRTLFDAVVEELRTEDVPTIRGGNEVSEHVDMVRVSVKCPPGAVGIGDPLAILKHMSASSANYLRERFVVRRVEAVGPTWTVVEAWRAHLAAVQQQGS